MKKQASDQQSHNRRYQERKRAEAAKQPAKLKAPRENVNQAAGSPAKETAKP
jgi:hypothetical protein